MALINKEIKEGRPPTSGGVYVGGPAASLGEIKTSLSCSRSRLGDTYVKLPDSSVFTRDFGSLGHTRSNLAVRRR